MFTPNRPGGRVSCVLAMRLTGRTDATVRYVGFRNRFDGSTPNALARNDS
jgi:hypothetical protein